MTLVDEAAWLTERFEEQRTRLRSVAYRMLGSGTEADDAVQDAWLRVSRADTREVDNLNAWLTTVVARVCLNMLRRRTKRREVPLDDASPAVTTSRSEDGDPEEEALLADSVGLALLVVLDTLTPAERLAFVLHDVFGVPFADIATALGRSQAATQQLASRARRRIQTSPEPDPDVSRQRRVVDAFFAASRDGDFTALLQVLDPDVTLRIDGGRLRADASRVLHGAQAVAAHTATYAKLSPFVVPALVNGAAGAVVAPGGRVMSVMGFTVTRGRIVQIDALVDPERLAHLGLRPSRSGPRP